MVRIIHWPIQPSSATKIYFLAQNIHTLRGVYDTLFIVRINLHTCTNIDYT